MARLALSIAPTMRPANSSVVSVFGSSVVMPTSTVGDSDQFNGPFREAHPVAIDDLLGRLPRVTGRPERDEQRREMLDRRMRIRHAWRAVTEVDKRVGIAGRQPLLGPRVEFGRPA